MTHGQAGLETRQPKRAAQPQRAAEPGVARTVYLVDPDLRTPGGHYLDYALAVYGEARRRGERFLAFVAADASDEVRRQLPAEPTFPRAGDHVARRGRLIHFARMGLGLFRQSGSAFAALRRATRSLPAGPALFFFPNASSMDILGFAWWIRTQPARDDVTYVFLVRWDHHVRGERAALHRSLLSRAFRLARRGRGAASVRIASDSAPLARSYGELLGEPVEVLPIPHTPHAAAEARPAAPGRPLHVVYVGGWRGEQGVGDLAGALVALRAELESGAVAATIQANPPGHDAAACASRDRLKAAALPGVDLIEQTLSRERFLECFEAADVLVVPYDSDIYRYRTSGIFAEAVALGKPVITTRGSWMAGELGEDEAILFDSGDPEGLARAVRAAAERLPALQARAARRRAAWTRFHNPRSFYDLLVSGPAEAPRAG